MKTIYIKRIRNSINGNPRYEINIKDYPECAVLGRKKRNSNDIRIFSSYNVESTLQDYFNEEIKVEKEV